MEKNQVKVFQQKLDSIVQEYLYNISSWQNHNYFKEYHPIDSRDKYNQSHGFGFLNDSNENDYVVKEEAFLEGCTRVFLINPIMRYLLDSHNMTNEWQYGHTFANFNITNREYELSNFIEFIAILDGKNIGIRYTSCLYSMEEAVIMERDSAFKFRKTPIPGYDKLRSIEFLYSIDWSGLDDEELKKIHPSIHGMTSHSEDISIRAFFEKYFSIEEYNIVIFATKEAIKRAKEIIALKAVPQLFVNNILQFKQSILEDFSLERMRNLVYYFQNNNNREILDSFDLKIIENNFFNLGRCNALIGSADFAKSFITSEYLFKTIKEGLSIDYTSIVVGYLKSVEQLLYLFYISAFEGRNEMDYWDKCNKTDAFDCNKPERYRYDPYDSNRLQEKYKHRKKSKLRAPEIGVLNTFLRYFDKMWLMSEKGKEYVFKCLDDFRTYCRNSHFHKDNIEFNEYDLVRKIRDNTHVCLYYLLGGFDLMDESITKDEQLGIIDFRFEMLYQRIRQSRSRCYEAEFKDGSKSVLYYLNRDEKIEYDGAGRIKDGCMKFLKMDTKKEDTYADEIVRVFEDQEYVMSHTLYVTTNNMPIDIKPANLKKRK